MTRLSMQLPIDRSGARQKPESPNVRMLPVMNFALAAAFVVCAQLSVAATGGHFNK